MSSCQRARASEEPGSTLAESHPKGSSLTPAASGATCRRTTPISSARDPHHGSVGSVTGARWQPAIHSSITDMMGFGHDPTGSIRCSAAPSDWRATAIVELASERVHRSRGLGCFETTDLAVSKPVVDEGQELSCDSRTRLVLAAALGDPSVVGAQLLIAALTVVADRFDRRPSHEWRSLLGDRSATDDLV